MARVQELQGWVLLEQRHTIMATLTSLHLRVPAEQEASAEAAMQSCISWLKQVDTALTRFDSTSELCRLNRAAGEWFAVSDLLFAVLEESLAAAAASDGLFDPTLLSLLEALGYDRDFTDIAHRETLVGPIIEKRVEHRSLLTGAWRRIQLDRRRRRVRLPLGAHLDFGGIAKGWSADVALERFFRPFHHVLINVGGDMRARGGQADGTPWPIGVGRSAQQAEQPESLPTVITLGSGGLATSGAADRWWYRAGQLQHHLLDPRTARPAALWIEQAAATPGSAQSDQRLFAAATALAPTAAHAEVAAKVALLRGYPAALQMVDAAWDTRVSSANPSQEGPSPRPYGDSGVALILTLETGEVVCSQHVAQYLTRLGGGGNLWLS